jgi:hypothetical protein
MHVGACKKSHHSGLYGILLDNNIKAQHEVLAGILVFFKLKLFGFLYS